MADLSTEEITGALAVHAFELNLLLKLAAAQGIEIDVETVEHPKEQGGHTEVLVDPR